jgi:hypothetical protein
MYIALHLNDQGHGNKKPGREASQQQFGMGWVKKMDLSIK